MTFLDRTEEMKRQKCRFNIVRHFASGATRPTPGTAPTCSNEQECLEEKAYDIFVPGWRLFAGA
jgi:hypothetical protein